MNYTKFFGIGLVCISTSVGFSTLSHAENSIFTKNDTQQKQWVGKPAPMFKLQDQHKKEVALSIRSIGKSGVVDIKQFYELFPKGPLKISSKMAGIPKPKSCI